MKILLRAATVISLATAPAAQDAPFHSALRDRIDQGFVYSDCWGSRTLGFVGRWGFDGSGNNQVDIIDVSNPDNIVKLATYSVPSPSNGASAQDMQAASGIMYVGLEASAVDGVDIVDIRVPGSPVHKTFVDPDPGAFEIAHDVFFDNGWLYMCNSRDDTLAILDLRTYDVNSPPAQISSWTYSLANLGDPGPFVHDTTVRNGELYVSGWGSLEIWDVADIATSAPSFLGEVRGFNVHSDWPSPDEAFLVTCEERQGGAAKLYQMIDNGSSVTLIPRDSWVNPISGSGEAYCPHDPRIVGDRVYISNYSAGVLVLQVDRTNWTWEKVASYDTSVMPGNDFFGVWGAYPFLGEDRVLASDLEEGFHVIDFSALEINHLTTRPTLVAPGVPHSISVRIDAIGNRVLSSVALRTRVDGGGAFQSTPMVHQGGNVYAADLPAIGCGSKVDWYVSATATNAEVFHSPSTAPTRLFSAYAGDGLTSLFSDDFQANLGWTVTNTAVASGAWTRVNPVESGAQPDNGDPDSPGANCFITGNAGGGGGVGDADLDGGPTVLTSPLLDFSSGDGLIAYKRWYFTNSNDDSLVVQISNNGGSSWTALETVTRKGGGWIERTFRVSDFVAPTSDVRVRFSVSDNPNDSITEAGVDSFVASRIECSGPAASVTSRNGTGVNALCYVNLTLPVLGSNWNTRIDHAHHPGAQQTWITARVGPATGPITPHGELLVDLGSPFLFSQPVPSSGTSDLHVIPMPADPALAGLTARTQGLIVGGGIELCNALDATAGF